MSSNTLTPPKIAPQSGFSGILRERETYASGDPNSMSGRIDGWFDRLMLQCNWGLAPAAVLMLAVLCAIALGGAMFVWKENLLLAAVVGMIGFTLPFIAAMAARANRQRQMNQQLPGMIDELSRAARTGRSLESCMNMVGNDTPSPLGDELRLCTSKMALGIPVDEALRELPDRTGLVAASVLTTAISVHRQSGGDIVKVLDRLSHTIRDREQFQGRLQAATRASQLTAFLMIGLPPIILAFFLFRDPDYFKNLMDSSWGRMATVTAVLLQIIGSIWVWNVLASSRKA
ncbi:MAG: type II secretion system F family protein [Planctomycetaceae bacterium]